MYVLASRVTTSAGFVLLQAFPQQLLLYAQDGNLYGFQALVSRMHNATMRAVGVDDLDDIPAALPPVPDFLQP